MDRRTSNCTDGGNFNIFFPMAGRGSTGNVIAALASFFIPGLGQLLQGKLVRAILMFLLAAILWWILLGWIIHLWSILDAALYRAPVETTAPR
jgi:TM2 domain-containing membrane protein YozV